MKATKVFVFFLVFVIAASVSYSFEANSSNYKLFPLIVSSGGETVNSSNYKSYAATGIIAGITNSSTYKNWLGFFYTWLLGDGQPCTSASQCEGGYCCSNLCSSSACPTPPEEEGGGGGGVSAGGGGGVVPKREEFSVSPSSIKVRLVLGESSKEVLKIKNTGDVDLTVYLAMDGVREFASLSEYAVDVKAGEEEDVELGFTGNNVGSFTGKVTARAVETEKIVPIVIEVISELVLFDVKLDIPTAYIEVEPGDELKTQITLLNVGAPEKVDVFATYFIKDLSGNIIYELTETFAVEKQVSYQKSFKIDNDTVPGSYVAIVEIRYADSFAVSSQIFRVVEKKALVDLGEITKNTGVMVFLVLILVGFIFLMANKLIPFRKPGKKGKKGSK